MQAGGPGDSERSLATLEPRLRWLLPAELYARVWLDPGADALTEVFGHLRALGRILHDQVPSHVADAPPPVGELRHEWQSGTLMFTDLAGFTRFMESHAPDGRDGAVQVHEVLNRYFATMIETCGHAGGNLLEFTGDAMLVRFADHGRGDDVARAVNAGLRMQRAMSEFAAVPVPGGTASLGMRVGIHTGRFLAADVGTPRRRDHVLFGEAVRRTKAAEGAGTVGRVCLTPEARDAVADRFGVELLDDGHSLVVDDLTDDELGFYDLNPRGRRPRTPLIFDRDVDALLADVESSIDLVEPLAAYMPRPVLEVMVETANDRRIPLELTDAVVMFVKLEGIDTGVDVASDDDLADMVREFSALFAQIDAVVSARKGMVRKVTYQASGSDVLVSFGVLDAHPDDAARAAGAALAIRDLVAAHAGAHPHRPVTCRIGVHAGPVFAAEMGVHLGRREFNLVGDTVNVASRLTAGALPMHVLLEGALADRLAGAYRLGPKEQRMLKGKARELDVVELLGAAEETA